MGYCLADGSVPAMYRSAPCVKSDLPFGGNWSLQHLAKSGENGMEFGVVAFFHFVDFATQILVRGEHRAELQKSTHDGDVDLHGAVTVKYA
jgi:hypothetical protein